jgi:hypothetical protein
MEWRPVKGFENFYLVSDCGIVKSLRFNREMKQRINPNGYLQVCLKGNGKSKTAYAHRLVAEAFLGDPLLEQTCINHKDEIKTNNSFENLEWCTKAYNNSYNGKMEKCYKAVVATDTEGFSMIFENARIAAEATGANYKNISACCHGKRPTAAGYKWSFTWHK